MRLVFAGAAGTGKSTLVNRLKDDLIFKDHDFLDGIGRFIHTHKQWSLCRKQKYFNRWYVWNHLLIPNYVSSRSIYDTFAYSRLLLGLNVHKSLIEVAISLIKYDYVFYIPIEFPAEKDGVRYDDPHFNLKHDKETKLIMDYHRIPYITLTGSIDNRIEDIHRVIEDRVRNCC